MSKKNFSLLLFSFLFLFTLNLQAQNKLIDALNKHLITLNTLNPDSNYSDLELLKPFLVDKVIFGLGEATHGTHEFSLFKHRMLEFLVKEMGVKAFVIEDDFAKAQILNNYILNEKDTVSNVVRKGLVFGTWHTQEMVEMCNWLKKYNSTQANDNKVRFFGCDIQWTPAVFTFIRDYLIPQGKFTPEMSSALSVTKKSLIGLVDSDKKILRTAVDQLIHIKLTLGDTALFHHYIYEAQQFCELVDSSSKPFSAKEYEWRDQRMAENIEWVYNYIGKGKMMIWAHNAHVAKSGGSMNVVTMGQNLSTFFGAKYYAMGFDFFKGSMRSLNVLQHKYETQQLPEAVKGSIGAAFSKCKTSNFIIDVKSTSDADPTAMDFFNKKVLSVSQGPIYSSKFGMNYVTYQLEDSFDAIIFIKETTAVHNIL